MKICLYRLLVCCLTAGAGLHGGVLIEAESFAEKGGWVVDQQFSEQMGSFYLLAHGLGEPVDDAITVADFPDSGTYHVWVRTTNWRPGPWDAPGRFLVRIEETRLDSIFGTQAGWQWQYGGSIPVKAGPVVVQLIDLTGFEGRCDAVYFSIAKKRPPSDPEELKSWRDRQLGFPDVPETAGEFDVVVTGGGIAGCAASIAAAKQGLSVALIHDRPVLGGNASPEIRVHMEGIPHLARDILDLIDTKHWPNGSPDAKADAIKRHRNMDSFKSIHQFLEWRAFRVQKRRDRIESVDARHTRGGQILRFTAPLFIDCTGDGWIGYWAGATMMYGRENQKQYNEEWDEHGRLWCPTERDNRVMGASILWRTRDTGGFPAPFPEVPWAMDVAKGHIATSGTWHWEYSDENKHQINDAEAIRDHLLCAIYGSFYNAKTLSGKNNLKLEWVGYLTGKRESRRILGDYIYTFNDVREGRQFVDAVVREKRPVDVHYQQNQKDPTKPDFLSEALFFGSFRAGGYYDIPFRCLYAKDIPNLMMAGRCFSCSHIGLGGPRVMYTTGQMGVAVGTAAALCLEYETSPRGVYREHIDELRNRLGW